MVMLIKIRWFILLPVLISNITFAQTVLINQLLASNVTDHPEMVDFDDYSDWLELYNPDNVCLLYTSPSPRDATLSRMPSSA